MGMLLLHYQLAEDSMVKLDRICREANVMLIFAHFYSLTGFVRISVKYQGLNYGGSTFMDENSTLGREEKEDYAEMPLLAESHSLHDVNQYREDCLEMLYNLVVYWEN
ncbi:NEDD8-activating enzyme E1 regulatory subunit AXL [Camellia lanceoleosa]|uniref:NEDD8-activating enzyme E1 regulatory subunit AXL n=1 Tax=Camellia lanceoleosa TaxID=1840588 RepID=A0ACC0I969_9ERIC|nr:NEDD8-activating enzyme E1 regulatory subunit AXL [Camellia lanceoleosa]